MIAKIRIQLELHRVLFVGQINEYFIVRLKIFNNTCLPSLKKKGVRILSNLSLKRSKFYLLDYACVQYIILKTCFFNV